MQRVDAVRSGIKKITSSQESRKNPVSSADFAGDGGLATKPRLASNGTSVDAQNNLYIADSETTVFVSYISRRM